MPPKKGYRKRKYAKKSKDKKQDGRIKKLESFVYKTIENKQINWHSKISVSSGGVNPSGFISLNQGTGDGSAYPSSARIGNDITLMSQRFDMNLIGETGTFNQIRVLIVESMDGNQPLSLADVLHYNSYTAYEDQVFVSPYTTKTTTNRRYKVHFDRLVELHGTGDAGKATAQLSRTIRWKNGKVVEFNDDASAPTSHRMSVLAISDSAAVGHPSLSYSVRTTFKDA